MAHLFLSAAHKSSGKTTLAIGITRALARRGMAVQTFKKGPDYIDPMWLTRAAITGAVLDDRGQDASKNDLRSCRNLDYYTMTEGEILTTFSGHAHGADLSLIEGNKGLYDGLDLDGSNSNAALATLTGAPIILVIDARGMTRGIAPLILGYQAFDPNLNIAGIILNKVGGVRHEGKLRAIIDHYTHLPVLGAVHRDDALEITERHLGLVPSNETGEAEAKIDACADAVEAYVDLDRILEISDTAAPLATATAFRAKPVTADVRIGIARDAAFGFYYPDDLEALETAGAELIPVNMLADSVLPDLDGLFIGGGFPETHMEALAANRSLLDSIRTAIEGGLPAYAECGGLMVLSRSLTWRGKTSEMAGVIPGDVVMHERAQGRGYVRLADTGKGPWPLLDAGGRGKEIAAHEFHYSSLENLDADPVFAYDVRRGHGIDGAHDGIVLHNLLATYAHMRDNDGNRWAGRFVNFVRQHKSERGETSIEGDAPAQQG